MRFALFSDLHAAQDGWAALRRHPEFSAADQRVCLGDVVDAGDAANAEPFFREVAACVDTVVLGNHEAVLAGSCDVSIFSAGARSRILAARQSLATTSPGFVNDLVALPAQVQVGGAAARHASFDPATPWQHVRYIEDVQRQSPHLSAGLSFLAHGHVPFIAWAEGGLWYYQRQLYGRLFRLHPGRRYLVNTGSVLGSREMRHRERTLVSYDDQQCTIRFHNLAAR